MKKNIIFLLLIFPCLLSAQEALKSAEENYFEFLSLQGAAARPALNYRTLSDSVWNIADNTEHLWQEQNLGVWRPLFGDFRLRIYGPQLYMSYNTAAPYGQNDGVLWQGRGFNSSLKGGVRFEGYGLELTILPHLAFSQNLEFDYIQPVYSGENYSGKAQDYGYYGVPSIDAPQRFGSKAFFDWDFGDSEIRYSWRTLTIGFGTQAIWLGPAQINPIILSNNAPAYPKLDIGLRRQSITLPKWNLHLGDVEFRIWWGYLSESDWFDNDDSNNHNLLSGVSFAYSFPSIFKGLTVGVNRIMLSKWDKLSFGSVFSLFNFNMDGSHIDDESDQRTSIIIDYLLPIAGINIYFEWGINDATTSSNYLMSYPFHSRGYSLGVKKAFSFSNFLKGDILLEITILESSRNFDLIWPTTFYAHHEITQGHTNRGQWLGAGIGTGGNSQFLGFNLYFPMGYGSFFIQRRNPDLDYTWFYNSSDGNFKSFWDFGISNLYYFTSNLSVFTSIIYSNEYNPFNDLSKTSYRNNFNFAASVKYSF